MEKKMENKLSQQDKEIIRAMTAILQLFLDNNKKELRLDKCPKCKESVNIDTYKLSSECTKTIFYLLKCKKII